MINPNQIYADLHIENRYITVEILKAFEYSDLLLELSKESAKKLSKLLGQAARELELIEKEFK